MKLLGFMLLVLLTEYIFGVNTTPVVYGGDVMKIHLIEQQVLPDIYTYPPNGVSNLTAEDMLLTISSLDRLYNYEIFRSFNEQFVVVALLKSDSDVILDMQYMRIDTIKAWYDDKLDEYLEREKEEDSDV